MSKTYKRDTFPYAFASFVLVVVLMPVVPICLVLCVLLFLFKIKGIYTCIISITSFVMLLLLDNTALQGFANEMFTILRENLNVILSGHFFKLDIFFQYSLSSWFVIFTLGLFLASLYKIRKDKLIQYEKVGIKPLKKEVQELQKENKQDTQKLPQSVLIGINDSNKKVFCPVDSKHFLVGGTTGAGKTVVLSNFIKTALTENLPVLLVDGKGDTGKGSILEITKQFCKEKNRKLITIDMGNPNTSDHYNPFKDVNATIATDMLITMSDWTEEHYKANTKRYIQRLCQLLIQNGEKLSYNKIISCMSSSKFNALSNELVKKEVISKAEHVENDKFYQTVGTIAESSFSRFATLAESEPGKIFCSDGINITDALFNNDVILFILNPLLYPDTSALLGRLILIDSKQAVSSLFGSESRKFFIFDEVNVYASSVLLDLVNKSRSANVTCLLGTQSLADLEAVSPQFKEQTIENCNNYIILRQNAPEGAEEWAKTIGTMETMKMTYQISSDTDEETQKGSARRTREFIVHPDLIKNLAIGDGYFISRDYAVVEKIRVNKPF